MLVRCSQELMRDAMQGKGQKRKRRKRTAQDRASAGAPGTAPRRGGAEEDNIELDDSDADGDSQSSASKPPKDPFMAALDGLNSNMASIAQARLIEANAKKEQGGTSSQAELLNAQARLKEAEANAEAQKAAAETSKGMLAVLTALAAKLG